MSTFFIPAIEEGELFDSRTDRFTLEKTVRVILCLVGGGGGAWTHTCLNSVQRKTVSGNRCNTLRSCNLQLAYCTTVDFLVNYSSFLIVLLQLSYSANVAFLLNYSSFIIVLLQLSYSTTVAFLLNYGTFLIVLLQLSYNNTVVFLLNYSSFITVLLQLFWLLQSCGLAESHSITKYIRAILVVLLGERYDMDCHCPKLRMY